MAKKKIAVTELSTGPGTAPALVKSPKLIKRATITKHSKAKSAPVAIAAPLPGVQPAQAVVMSEREEIALAAYFHSEARGFQGGSPHEDWLRAEQEVRKSRS